MSYTKITLEQVDHKDDKREVVIKEDVWGHDIHDMLQMIRSLLLAWGYSETTVNDILGEPA